MIAYYGKVLDTNRLTLKLKISIFLLSVKHYLGSLYDRISGLMDRLLEWNFHPIKGT